MTTAYCWAFEAKSIQEYLFETGRLADAVGASLLVDRLCGELGQAQGGDLLGHVLDTVLAGRRVRFARRGGGSFIAFFDDAALRARARGLWHAALQANAPGLRWTDGLGDADDARQAAAAALQACHARNQFPPPALPEAGPATRRVPRTGLAAVQRRALGAKGQEWLDEPTLARRRHGGVGAGRSLPRRFRGDGALRWPRDLGRGDAPDEDGEAFPFAGGGRDVAVVHADGNGLGQALHRLKARAFASDDEYIETYAAFSQAVGAATQAAARRAGEQVLAPAAVDGRVPARPLVLGGDDLTVLVRADLALPFVEAFLLAFGEESGRALAASACLRDLGLAGLSAAAGVAIVNAGYPFAAASELAESLCAQAKRVIKDEARASGRALPLPALAFAAVTASTADTQALRVPVGRDDTRAWLGCPAYVLADARTATTLPRLADLQRLTDALGDAAAPRGPARRLLNDWAIDPPAARERWRRWREIQGKSADGRRRLAEVDAALRALGVPEGAPLPRTDGPSPCTPWPDALVLADCRHKAGRATRTDDDDQEAA